LIPVATWNPCSLLSSLPAINPNSGRLQAGYPGLGQQMVGASMQLSFDIDGFPPEAGAARRLERSGQDKDLAPRAGLEPATIRLTVDFFCFFSHSCRFPSIYDLPSSQMVSFHVY
jgi:hypothetical protein